MYHVWVFGSPDGERVEAGRITALLPDLAFGVTLFFVLSGFLLYLPFANALIHSAGRPSFRSYLRNRVLRIAPAYVVIVLLASLVLRSVFVRDAEGRLEDGAAPSVGWLAANLSLTQNYQPSGVITGIGPAWSLAVEVVFYLLLPLLVLAAAAVVRLTTTPVGRVLAALVPSAVLLVVGVAGKTVSLAVGSGPDDGWGADWSSVLERSFFAQADLFAFGIALAVITVVVRDRQVVLGARPRAMLATGALAAYVFTTASMPRWEQLGHAPQNTVAAIGCALFLALVVLPSSRDRPAATVRLLETQPLVLVGLLSYSIFLWHVPVIFALREHGATLGGTWGPAVNVLVVGCATLALSVLTYRFVEQPALRRKASPRPAGGLPAPPSPGDRLPRTTLEG